MTEEEIKIWDQYAMEFFKARLGDSNFWQPQNLAEMSYKNTQVKPDPFVKWVGGKRQLMSIIKENLPEKVDRYLESFLGGGAVLFNISYNSALANDINKELITTYKTIKVDLESIINELKKHKEKNSESHFYETRALNPKDLSDAERAARFIYLNKTCFNGVYRENSKGKFNVPYGKQKSPNILDEPNLRAINELFNSKKIEFFNLSYSDFLLENAREGDFIYLDPPYYPLKKNSFTKYNKGDFLEEEQKRLLALFIELTEKGCKIMQSNSNSDFIKTIYSDFQIIEVEASRSLNSDASNRGKQKIEVLIKNYK